VDWTYYLNGVQVNEKNVLLPAVGYTRKNKKLEFYSLSRIQILEVVSRIRIITHLVDFEFLQ
jgi:hypothetical protein